MAMALNKSTDGGTTFQQVSVDVADYTLNTGVVANQFYSIKDSENNTFILCCSTTSFTSKGKLIKIDSGGVKSIATLDWVAATYTGGSLQPAMALSRDGNYLFVASCDPGNTASIRLHSINKNFANGASINVNTYIGIAGSKFAIYQDRYIWVASGNTVKIYDYDTKVSLDANGSPASFAEVGSMAISSNNVLYSLSRDSTDPNWNIAGFYKSVFNGTNTITSTRLVAESIAYPRQLLIDRFGDLIILTNTGTASTLLKYSNTGTLIDTVNLSVAGILGVGRGAYGLQVYSSDNGTKCWVQFSNDLGTWVTVPTTAQGQVFPGNKEDGTTIIKLRNNGVTTYGGDHGGDDNYSVRC